MEVCSTLLGGGDDFARSRSNSRKRSSMISSRGSLFQLDDPISHQDIDEKTGNPLSDREERKRQAERERREARDERKRRRDREEEEAVESLNLTGDKSFRESARRRNNENLSKITLNESDLETSIVAQTISRKSSSISRLELLSEPSIRRKGSAPRAATSCSYSQYSRFKVREGDLITISQKTEKKVVVLGK